MAGRGLVHHQFEVYRATPLESIVDDVVRPSFALDVDQYAVWKIDEIVSSSILLLLYIYIKLTFRPLEENSYEGAEVSGGVCEGEVVTRETSTRNVLNRAHVLHVGWILARARDPHRVQPVRVLLRFDVLLKIGGHGGGQILRVVVIFRLPAENLTGLY